MPRRIPLLRASRLTLTSAAFLAFSALAFGQVETILHNFIQFPSGANPSATVVADSAGNLYGTSSRGGVHGFGSVFKLVPASKGQWTETVLYSFTDLDDGEYPASGLVFDAAGNLYGTTSSGGTACFYEGCGTVFELSPNADGTWSLSTLHTFGASGDGIAPSANLIMDSAGNLYGTTYDGGPGHYGTVFELSPSQDGWTESILYSFTDSTDGAYPASSLTFDKAGNLYGTSEMGGDVSCNNYGQPPVGCGNVFELLHNFDGTWTESTLHSFEIFDGWNPTSAVIFDAAGNLEGTTLYGPGFNCNSVGCGTVFQMTPSASGWTLRTVYNFAGGPDGATPQSPLISGADGNFYGTTSAGGNTSNCTYGCGTVYQLTPTAQVWTEKIIHNFSGSVSAPDGVDGSDPVAGLIFDQFGNLYGTAAEGGTKASSGGCNGIGCGNGTVFKLSKNSQGQWATSLLYAFSASNDGSSPGGVLDYSPGLVASAGVFYGTTIYGGAYSNGTVYQMTPKAAGGYNERVIYSFMGGADGTQPVGGLVSDSAGNLYGTTSYGGANANCTNSYGCGTVFELSPAGGGKWTETILHAFATSDGSYVNGPLVMDAAGNLFGSTQGLNSGPSTIFELSPSAGGWNFSVLYTFTGNVGGAYLGQAMDAAGNLYGIAAGGVGNGGVVYELSPGASGWTFSVIHDFHGGADGDTPFGIVFDRTGALIGVTAYGGNTHCQYGCGTVFALVQSGGVWQKRDVYNFTGGADAAYPIGSLVLDAAGNIYGSSNGGGTGCTTGCGTVFKLSFTGGAWRESVLYNVGSIPFDVYRPSLLWTPTNVLLGAGQGGAADNGVVFELNLNQSPQSVPSPASPRPRPPLSRTPYQPNASAAQDVKGGN